MSNQNEKRIEKKSNIYWIYHRGGEREPNWFNKLLFITFSKYFYPKNK